MLQPRGMRVRRHKKRKLQDAIGIPRWMRRQEVKGVRYGVAGPSESCLTGGETANRASRRCRRIGHAS